MPDPDGGHLITIALAPLLRQFLEVDPGLELLERDGKDDRRHLVPHHPVDARLERLRAPDREAIPLLEERREEGNALDVVPVGVGQEDVAGDRFAVRVARASARPSSRMPVPASRMISQPSSVRSSTQGVLPPYRTVSGPGLGMEPRVPQKVSVRLIGPWRVTFESARASPARRGWPRRCGGARRG